MILSIKFLSSNVARPLEANVNCKRKRGVMPVIGRHAALKGLMPIVKGLMPVLMRGLLDLVDHSVGPLADLSCIFRMRFEAFSQELSDKILRH